MHFLCIKSLVIRAPNVDFLFQIEKTTEILHLKWAKFCLPVDPIQTRAVSSA